MHTSTVVGRSRDDTGLGFDGPDAPFSFDSGRQSRPVPSVVARHGTIAFRGTDR